MGRLEDLQTLRTGLVERMKTCESDQNFAVLGRLLVDVVKQIDDLEPAGAGKVTGLSDFEKRLAERRSAPKAAGRSKSS